MGRKCYLEMFKKYFKVEFFEGSSESPLDKDQTTPIPDWAAAYYSHLNLALCW